MAPLPAHVARDGDSINVEGADGPGSDVAAGVG
jgi:hypothetical protein